MRISSAPALLFAAVLALACAPPAVAQDVLKVAAGSPAPVVAPDAIDAAQALASALDGAAGGVTASDQINALQDAATAGDPMAKYQLALMYESGEGVPKNPAKAFGYFAGIANDYADIAPKGLQADVVAQSFIKMGDYFSEGLPEAGIAKNEVVATQLLSYAASYFRDPEAQYRMGLLYLDKDGQDHNPALSVHWLNLAAKKGYVAAQARLGDLLFNGDGDYKASPVEGLMWLSVASRGAVDTVDAQWIDDLLNTDMSVASPDQRKLATTQADALETQLPRL